MSLATSHPWRDAETSFLESLRAEYEGKGYEFVIHPRSSDLPDFFASYQPDAVATKDDHSIAIEVKSRASSASHQSIQRLRKLFEGHPEWRFTVAYMGSDFSQTQGLPKADRGTILARAKEVERLAKDGDAHAAFVVAWGLLEAALNAVQPDADARPRKPGTVVQALAMNGYIPYELESPLRLLVDTRNRVVHGDLTVEPTEKDVRIVLAAVYAALGQPIAGSIKQT